MSDDIRSPSPPGHARSVSPNVRYTDGKPVESIPEDAQVSPQKEETVSRNDSFKGQHVNNGGEYIDP